MDQLWIDISIKSYEISHIHLSAERYWAEVFYYATGMILFNLNFGATKLEPRVAARDRRKQKKNKKKIVKAMNVKH